MPTFNQYAQEAPVLDGGLDFITPKVSVGSGTLKGCFNFERTDRIGYSRIMGYEYFDGSISPSKCYTNTAYITHTTNAGSHPILTPLKVDGRDELVGVIIAYTSTKTLISISNFDEWRLVLAAVNAGNTITLVDPRGTATDLVVSGIQSFEEGYTPANSNAQVLTLAKNSYFKSVNSLITYPGPAANPVIGLIGYKDNVYAIKDLQTVYFTLGSSRVFPNMTLRPAGGGDDIYVAEVRVVSGNWTGTAIGVLEIVPSGTFANGSYDIIDPVSNTVLVNDALNLASAPGSQDMSATNAGMWKSTSFTDGSAYAGGWENVSLGFYASFNAATQYGPFHISRRGEFSDYTTDITTAEGHGTTGSTTNATGTGGQVTGTWNIVPTGDVPASVNNATGNTNRARCTLTGTVAPANIPHIDMGAVNIPDLSTNSGATIKGVEVKIRALNRVVPGFSGYLTVAALLQTSGANITDSATYESEITANDFNESTTFGGPEDLWGLDEATMKAALDPATLGVRLNITMQPDGSGNSQTNIFDIYDIKVVVYFTQEVTQYYFYDGVDDVTADVTYYYVTSNDDGHWEEDASGVLQVTNIQPSGSATRNYIKNGDGIYTEPLGNGLKIAEISSDMAYNGLDTLAEIQAAKSRYQMITSNFFANEDFEAIYGVSGAGRAFSYDGFYFTRIFTQADETKDKPRHVANHQFHLALGYRAGAVLLSVTGNPLDFLGINGATEIDTGDPVVGFSRMQGTTLGIFCRDSIQGLVGTSADNFSLSVLSPYEGAIEYTVCDIGKPIYCSYKGISFFDQTAAYGDFSGARLSYQVSPFLLPRLVGAVNPLGVAASTSGPIMAIACRAKNQYRLYFGDGYRLTLTLAGSEQQPMFTTQADILYDDSDEYVGNFVPRAETSYVDSNGAEHIMLSHYSAAVPLDTYYVYEFEKSWTYGGVGIPAFIVTNEMFMGSPFNFDNIRKLRLHGLSLGYAPIRAYVDTDYGLNETVEHEERQSPNTSLPSEPASTLYYDYNPYTSMGQMASRGRSMSVRFMSYDLDNQVAYLKDPVYADVCPPFVIQAMLPQYTENKGDV